MGFVAIQAPRCQICRKSVYQAEQILHDETPYHKSCFKCAKCKCQLTALNFAAFDGKLFCKTHFKELLANAGGKYDVAFQNDDDEKEGKKTDDEKKGEGKGSGKSKKEDHGKAKGGEGEKKKANVKTMAAKTNASTPASSVGEKDTSKDGCVCCERTVYAAEAVNVVVGNKKVHKRCFKCSECLVTLSLNTFVFDKETAKLYCKTHTPKMKAHVGLDGVYGLQKAETKVSHLGGRQVMPKVEQAPKVTIDAIVGHAQPDLRSFSVGRNVMPGNEPKLVTMKNNNSNNKENKAEKKPEPVDYTSPSATPSGTKKTEKGKKVFTLETPPLTASVEKKKKAEQQQQQQQKSGALEEKKQQQQEAQKRAEKTSHEMSIKKSRSGSRSPSESLTSAGSEEIAKKQLIEALSGVSIKEEEQKKEKTTKMVEASSIPLAATSTPDYSSKKKEEKGVAAGTGTPITPAADNMDKKGGDPYVGMTKSQIKKAKEREKMRAKEQLKYEKDLEKKAKELEIRKRRQEALASASASSLSTSVPKADPASEPVKVQEIVEQIEPPLPPPPEPNNFYLIKPPGAKTSPDSGELQSKGYELDNEGKLVQSTSFSGSESKEKLTRKKKEKKTPAEKFLPAKSEVSMSEEGSKMFKTPSKIPTSIIPPEATIDGKVGTDAELISPKGENKVSPRRSIGHIAPEPISSPTLTAPSAEVISNSPGSNAKKEEKKQKLKPGEAVALEEKPKLKSAQVYSFKELQASGFAFDDENEIVQSDNDSDSYMSESDGATPRMAQVREGHQTTPSTLNITSTTPFSN